MKLATDWEAYYRRRSLGSYLTRPLTARIVVQAITRAVGTKRNLTLVEFGGGNSCVLPAILRTGRVAEYGIYDSSPQGIRLARKNFKRVGQSSRWWAKKTDLLGSAVPSLKADGCVSLGLIEHFSPRERVRLLRRHFQMVKKGGFILVTFPTPTWLYRLIRRTAEWLGQWRFPDETPLTMAQIESEAPRGSRVILRKLIWTAGLTQGLVLFRK